MLAKSECVSKMQAAARETFPFSVFREGFMPWSNITWSTALPLVVSLWVGLVDARAQTYGTDYLAFHGRVYVLDNPPSPTCSSYGIRYGDEYTFVYRYIANHIGVAYADSLTFYVNDRSAYRIIPTSVQSLNGGPVAITWSGINQFGNLFVGSVGGNSTMTISSGNNTPVSIATGNMKIIGARIDNFINVNCTIMNLHGAGVAMPP
jgi:hypothetical protein